MDVSLGRGVGVVQEFHLNTTLFHVLFQQFFKICLDVFRLFTGYHTIVDVDFCLFWYDVSCVTAPKHSGGKGGADKCVCHRGCQSEDEFDKRGHNVAVGESKLENSAKSTATAVGRKFLEGFFCQGSPAGFHRILFNFANCICKDAVRRRGIGV